MCKDAIAHKLDLVKQLGVVLQGTVKPSEPLLLEHQENMCSRIADRMLGEAAFQ